MKEILIFSVVVIGGIWIGAALFIACVEYIKRRFEKLK